MAKHANIIPSQQLNVALPLPLYTQLSAALYSELEGRVPHGGYSRFMIAQLQKHFAERTLDLAPWLGCAAGSHIVQGTPETLIALKQVLTSYSCNASLL